MPLSVTLAADNADAGGAVTHNIKCQQATLMIDRGPVQIVLPQNVTNQLYDLGWSKPRWLIEGVLDKTQDPDDASAPTKNTLETFVTGRFNAGLTLTVDGRSYTGKIASFRAITSGGQEFYTFQLVFVSTQGS